MTPAPGSGGPVGGRTSLVSVAGFLPDLRAGLARHGLAITLGDEVPFTEFFAGLAREELLQLVPRAAELLGVGLPRSAVPSPLDGLPRSLDAVVLEDASVQTLARIDDTRLRPLWNRWWQGVAIGRSAGGPGSAAPGPDPDLTQSVRGFVVQARAAVANGWAVVLAGARPADR